jgi:hypothetical protein
MAAKVALDDLHASSGTLPAMIAAKVALDR